MWTNPFRTLLGKESIADYSEMELTEINTAGELEELTLGEFDEEELNLNFEELGEDFQVQEPMDIIPQEQLPRPLDSIPKDDLELGEGYEVEAEEGVEYAEVELGGDLPEILADDIEDMLGVGLELGENIAEAEEIALEIGGAVAEAIEVGAELTAGAIVGAVAGGLLSIGAMLGSFFGGKALIAFAKKRHLNKWDDGDKFQGLVGYLVLGKIWCPMVVDVVDFNHKLVIKYRDLTGFYRWVVIAHDDERVMFMNPPTNWRSTFMALKPQMVLAKSKKLLELNFFKEYPVGTLVRLKNGKRGTIRRTMVITEEGHNKSGEHWDLYRIQLFDERDWIYESVTNFSVYSNKYRPKTLPKSNRINERFLREKGHKSSWYRKQEVLSNRRRLMPRKRGHGFYMRGDRAVVTDLNLVYTGAAKPKTDGLMYITSQNKRKKGFWSWRVILNHPALPGKKLKQMAPKEPFKTVGEALERRDERIRSPMARITVRTSRISQAPSSYE